MKKRNTSAGIVVTGIVILIIAVFLWSAVHPINYDTGITGKILLGPTCPVERVNQTQQCYVPYQATVIASPVNGFGYVKFSSDVNGMFTVALGPGTYILDPLGSNSLYPRAAEQTITIEPSRFTNVLIVYDTGIR